jgi:hypothetical protein
MLLNSKQIIKFDLVESSNQISFSSDYPSKYIIYKSILILIIYPSKHNLINKLVYFLRIKNHQECGEFFAMLQT